MSANTARTYLYCKTEQQILRTQLHRQHLDNESLINRRISKNSLYNDLDLFPLQLKQGKTSNHYFRFHLANITTKSQYHTFHQLFIAHKSYISKPSGTIYRKNITNEKQSSSFYDIEKHRLGERKPKKDDLSQQALYTNDQNRNLTHERKYHARNILHSSRMVCPPAHDGFALHPTANPHFPLAHSSHSSQERGSKALKFSANLPNFYAKIHFFSSYLPAFSLNKDEDEKNRSYAHTKKTRVTHFDE